MPSAGGAVPLLNYQPALYQQATINIPGLTQQSVPIPTRPAGLCSQTEPFQQTLIVCPPSTIQGKGGGCIQTEKRQTKHKGLRQCGTLVECQETSWWFIPI